MYLWDIEGLKSSIRRGGVTEGFKMWSSVFLGCYASGVLWLRVIYPQHYFSIWDLIFIAFSFIYMIALPVVLFKANGGNQGQDFLGKSTALYMVMFIRFLPINIALWIGDRYYNIYLYENNLLSYYGMQCESALVYISVNLFIFWRLYKHMVEVNMEVIE